MSLQIIEQQFWLPITNGLASYLAVVQFDNSCGTVGTTTKPRNVSGKAKNPDIKQINQMKTHFLPIGNCTFVILCVLCEKYYYEQ
ncbi:MAG: hypothetical protein BGO34_00975 [Bacteroidia bacterium 44-10]|nr:MAG: hypothetical protein BGO34_00975 [Bacteroidia bacterium 44-10]